jgi:hypothetical protein
VWDKDAAKNKSKAAILIGHTGSSNYRSTIPSLLDTACRRKAFLSTRLD